MTGNHLPRANAFARLFEAVHEGVYIGTLSTRSVDTVTSAANPHLKLIFGYPPEVAEEQVLPFSPAQFTDPLARTTFLNRLAGEGAVSGPVSVWLYQHAQPAHAMRVTRAGVDLVLTRN